MIATENKISVQAVKEATGEAGDINYMPLHINGNKDFPVTLIYVDGMVNTKCVDDNILKPLLQEEMTSLGSEEAIMEFMITGGIYHNRAEVTDSFEDMMGDLLTGSAALVFEKTGKAVMLEVKGFERRGIGVPSDENVLKGSKDCFVESIRMNTATIRLKIRNQALRIKQLSVGKQSSTPVAVVYMDGIVSPETVNEIEQRINGINTDSVLFPAQIEEYIINNKYSIFPQVKYTERPDSFCANLLDGRVGILIDGMPVAYITPVSFAVFMQAPEDYSFNFFTASLIRIVRYASLLFALFLPGYYIAILAFNIEMLPADLALSIISSKEGVPFSTVMETMFMLIAFELLIQSGIRMPQSIGQAAAIIGGIIIGQAAVLARFLSPAVIVVIAFSGIAGFTLPSHDLGNTTRVLRFALALSAAIAGLPGLILASLGVCIHLSKIESFDLPYLSPYCSGPAKEIYEDTLIRLPMSFYKKRPANIAAKNVSKQA